MKLSIVIPTYNGRHWLTRSLPAVLRHRPPDSEVIVVDDASTDGTEAWLRRWAPEVRVIRRRSNGGFCCAINDGILAARGEFVETLNNDAVVTPGWAEAALRHFRDEQVAAVAPLVLSLADPTVVDSAGDGWHLCGRAYGHGNGQKVEGLPVGRVAVFGASASAAFFRREALLKVGLFPTEFGAYYDDIDLAFRLRYAGYEVVHARESVVLHAVHGSYGGLSAARIRQLARNEERVFWRWTPRAALPLAVPAHILYVLLHAALLWARGQPAAAYLRGRLDVWSLWDEIQRCRRQIPPRATLGTLRRFGVDTSLATLGQLVWRALLKMRSHREEPERQRRAA